MKPRLHLLALPHAHTTREWLTCAYSQKCVKFGKMMAKAGYQTFLYSGEYNDAEQVEHVPLLTESERLQWYKPRDKGDAMFGGVTWDPNHDSWRTFNQRAIAEVRARADHRDLLLLSMGCCHQAVSDALPHLTAAEPGVGYYGVSTRFRAFESYAWMHHVLGRRREENGKWYDAVIPNYFDRDDFPYESATGGDYLLFVGRVVQRKGPHIAAMLAERLGMKLLVAGPGVTQYAPGLIVSQEDGFEIRGPVEYVGVADRQERQELMRGAAAVICPTIYVEPFGGVAVEAMLAGAPVASSDYGAFTETVEEGLTGYRFHTLAEGADAIRSCLELDRQQVRQRALERYTLEAVAPMFDRWFTRLDGLWEGGWDA